MHWAPLSFSSSSICMNSYAFMPFYASRPTKQWGSFCASSFSTGTSTSGAIWISDCSHLNTRCYLYCPRMLSVLCIPVFLPSALASPLVLVDNHPPLIESRSRSAQGFAWVLGLGGNNWLIEEWSTCKVLDHACVPTNVVSHALVTFSVLLSCCACFLLCPSSPHVHLWLLCAWLPWLTAPGLFFHLFSQLFTWSAKASFLQAHNTKLFSHAGNGMAAHL